MGICTYRSLIFLLIASICFSHSISHEERKAYIVYMGSLPTEVEYTPSSHHLNILQGVLDGSTSAENSIIRSYGNSFNGFVAKLTEIEKQKIGSLEEVVSIFPDEIHKLQTTRSWDFMGFPEAIKRNKIIESDIIIGLLDTGIWPESESFNDKGFSPIPNKWKGQCPHSKSFPCNKKLIGARTLLPPSSGPNTPRDFSGHGTHTASTAAGNVISGANFFGLAQGSARGGVPSSRIAAYQVCNVRGQCTDSDLLAGFDVSISDGVDIISISIATEYSREFYEDSIAIGAFHAMEKGILTVQAAGNLGGGLATITSSAPWLFSIAASSIDRRIVSNTVLGNGKQFIGNAINSNTLDEKKYSLVYGKDATSSCSPQSASFCVGGCLDSKLVKGKIVICDDPVFGVDEAARAGALGAIIQSRMENVSYIFSLTTSALNPSDFYELRYYYDQSKGSSLGYINKTEAIHDPLAPYVAVFSSRGPNIIASDILKPDIAAPGTDILAAFSPMARLSTYPNDRRSTNYSLISGTSMACPHVAGASAYVKSFHPTWSPSAIKSALMTTAWVMSDVKNPEGEFAYGSGHLDPVKAVEPGLVYECDTDDYVDFMCKLGYNATKISLITRRKNSCKNNATSVITSPTDLNYPTMTTQIRSKASDYTTEFQRTVTNVGWANSTYKAVVVSGSNMEVKVDPSTLLFKSLNERKSFKVSVRVKGVGEGGRKSASITWDDGFHKVRSPIVIYKLNSM